MYRGPPTTGTRVPVRQGFQKANRLESPRIDEYGRIVRAHQLFGLTRFNLWLGLGSVPHEDAPPHRTVHDADGADGESGDGRWDECLGLTVALRAMFRQGR